ncbi:MAG TPA: cupin domain-containing protein [Beijerinckiaceae bacterium]|nr:cupin domain-containing protein [Beijerinckiaceae bacterium]
MNKAFVCAVAAAGLLGCQGIAQGETPDRHKLVSPEDIEWRSGPPSLPQGSRMAVLYGDPGKEGLFAMRLRLPDGYHIPPHNHPRPEVVTIVSGTFKLGMGEKADRDKTHALRSGSFFAVEPGHSHFAYTEGETVIQLNSFGPWSVTYVRDEDDPRKRTQ